MDLRLKYVWEDKDRHGNVRVYVAVPGRRKVRIREQPGTEAFLAAYRAAIEGVDRHPIEQHGRGSLGWLCKLFFASNKFQLSPPKGYDDLTKKWIRNELERICEKHGEKPIALMKPEHIRALRDAKPTPDGGNMRLKALRMLFKWAIEAQEAPHNPAKEVSMLQTNSDGYHTWTEDEITQFERRHPVGTKARLAMALMLYTTGRREDATRFGPQRVRGERIIYTQAKNERRRAVHMDIPIHPELKRVIDATPSGHLTFLVTQFGKPFSPAGFGNWFRDRCVEAGVPGRARPPQSDSNLARGSRRNAA